MFSSYANVSASALEYDAMRSQAAWATNNNSLLYFLPFLDQKIYFTFFKFLLLFFEFFVANISCVYRLGSSQTKMHLILATKKYAMFHGVSKNITTEWNVVISLPHVPGAQWGRKEKAETL